jgi:signal transduction histidine kinase
MALVLAGLAAFLYIRLDRELGKILDQGLSASADNIATLVRSEDAESALAEGAPGRLVETEENFAQVLDRDGTVLDSTPLVREQQLLTPDQLERARRATLFVDRVTLPGFDHAVKLLARPARASGQRVVVVVGTGLEDSDDALKTLRRELFIGGPIVLILAALGGYLLSRAALRPVETMRSRAAEISASTPGQRLPVPPANDEVSRLGETLNEMLARLEAAFARERRFVADASHELRTPLAMLRTELELAMRRTRTPDELEAAVRSAAEETDRLSQLAEDLLVLARADQGELPLRPSACDVDQLLERVATRFGRRAAEAGREIEREGEADVTIIGDPLRLEQALGNLVENALRYGGGRIVLSAAPNADRVDLHVVDEGTGFPAFFLETAFEPFSRGETARGRGGAGLGLSIVDVIARAHGGSAHAANVDSGGADVWLSLPLRSGTAGVAGKASAASA